MRILVTGAKGFVGKNLCSVLRTREGDDLFEYDVDSKPADLDSALKEADVIYHLAGVNRPLHPEEFETGNTGSIEEICIKLKDLRRIPKIVLSSSIQAELENPYGISKKKAEDVLKHFSDKTGAACVVYRFKNLFGKWCRPNYNSVTATFCHNIAHDLPIQISNPANQIDLTYIDDVVMALVCELEDMESGFRFSGELPSNNVTLGELGDLIRSFRDMRKSLVLPDFSKPFVRFLYATYLSYLPTDQFAYPLKMNVDQRGSFTEFVRTPDRGQVSVNISRPAITKGEHWHHTKNEKFLVVSGSGVIRFRRIGDDKILEYTVSGDKLEVIDIPPGYTHNISNTGETDMVTVMWASESFDPEHPDTYYEKV